MVTFAAVLSMAQIGEDIDFAVSLLERNELVAIPTETVYGLAGNALSEEAILKIYAAKNRPKFDPLIAHTDSVEKIKPLVKSIPEPAKDLASQFWPGPLTLLLEKSKKVPDLLTSGQLRVAIRIPRHPMTLALLERLDFPLAAPSANPFGYVSPTEASHVDNQLGDRIQYVLNGGACEVGLESTIVGFDQGGVVVHRLGGTKVEEIEKVVGNVSLALNTSSNPAAPGMLKSHYSPGRKLVLGDISENLKRYPEEQIGVISFMNSYVNSRHQFILSSRGNLEEAARNIFKALRKMDNPEVTLILAELLPDEGLGRAINDRLNRAAAISPA